MKMKRCPVCHKRKNLTIHHILPKRHFGETPFKYKLCRKCHDILKREWMPHKSKLEKDIYFDILSQFLDYYKVRYKPKQPIFIELPLLKQA